MGNALLRIYPDAQHLPGKKGDPGRSAADKGVLWIARVGSAWLRRQLDERGALAVIPPKADRKRDIPCDFAMYGWR